MSGKVKTIDSYLMRKSKSFTPDSPDLAAQRRLLDKPEDPRQEQFHTSAAPKSSGPFSRLAQSHQHDALSRGGKAALATDEDDDMT